jgi:biopolymer transport protein ExbD
MKFRKRRATQEEVSINLIPLIDVVFFIVIFLVMSMTFNNENRLKIELPSAQSGSQEMVDKQQLELLIDEKGHYTLNNKTLINTDEQTLRMAIEKESKGNKDLPFVITADANTPHHAVVTAMDIAGQEGFVHLRITTKHATQENQ